MRLTVVSLGIGLVLLSHPATAQEVTTRSRLSEEVLPTPGSALLLKAALALARQNNKLVQAAQLRIAEARGDLTGASLRLVNNPEFTGGAGPRVGPNTATRGRFSTDLELGVEQRFEMGGQRAHRVERARAGVEAATASASDIRRVVGLAVARTFYGTHVAERRSALLEENARLARELHGIAVRRLDAGEGTALKVHTARIRLAEVERRTLAARVAFDRATVRLAELLGVPPDTRLRLGGGLPTGDTAPPADLLVMRALRARPDLAAAGQQVRLAQASIGLADAEARPDIAVGAFYGREEGANIVTTTFRLPIPLFNKNQGARERARATKQRGAAEQEAVRLSIESEVRQARLEYEHARQALNLYTAEVVDAQQESADLLRRAFEAGEVSLQDVIVVQRELLDGREGFLEATLAVALARAQLLAGMSSSQSGPLEGATP
jgi:cobalt-zinc-cadmium efflux system outer membrane protein